MLDEYERELVNEILAEVERLRQATVARDKDAYVAAEDRIKAIAKTLKGERVATEGDVGTLSG